MPATTKTSLAKDPIYFDEIYQFISYQTRVVFSFNLDKFHCCCHWCMVWLHLGLFLTWSWNFLSENTG